MNLKLLTNKELLEATQEKSQHLREQTLHLLDLLGEINCRKLYCELSYSSLFKYIVDELKFSESQAAIYNHLIKSEVSNIVQVQTMIRSGELSLFNAAMASQVIREQNVADLNKKIELVNTFKNLSKDTATLKAHELMSKNKKDTKEVIILTKALKENIEKLKKKLNLSPDIKLNELVEFLVNDKLCDDIAPKENKTITPKTKQILKTKARQQCQYVNQYAKRCHETKYLEIDHITPLAMYGTNHPSNLRVYCREHNQKAAMDSMGSHTVKKRTSPAKCGSEYKLHS